MLGRLVLPGPELRAGQGASDGVRGPAGSQGPPDVIWLQWVRWKWLFP